MILGLLKLCFKLIFSVFIVIPIFIFILFGIFSFLIEVVATSPCMLIGIVLFVMILFIPLFFIIGIIKALIK